MRRVVVLLMLAVRIASKRIEDTDEDEAAEERGKRHWQSDYESD